MSDARKLAPALDFGPRGRRFWQDATDTCDFTLAELEQLRAYCRQTTLTDAYWAILQADGYTATGARGQDRMNPAGPAFMASQALETRLLAQLNMPNPAGETLASPATTRARRAAAARWKDHAPRGRSAAS